MAVSKDKIRFCITLDKKALELVDTIAAASPCKITRSEVIQFAIAEFYLSILESNEKQGRKEN